MADLADHCVRLDSTAREEMCTRTDATVMTQRLSMSTGALFSRSQGCALLSWLNSRLYMFPRVGILAHPSFSKKRLRGGRLCLKKERRTRMRSESMHLLRNKAWKPLHQLTF